MLAVDRESSCEVNAASTSAGQPPITGHKAHSDARALTQVIESTRQLPVSD